jgi:DNA-binding transcriptional regulator GbsR (MarR family)
MHEVVQRFVADAGNLTTSLGLGRAVGQVYALLYFSPQPQGLADMQDALGISKGSASMTVRQLEQWGAVRKIWVKGDRKDYYEANDWLGQIIRNVLFDTIGKRLTQSNGLPTADLGPPTSAMDPEERFIRERVEHLRKFQRRAQKVWENPVVRRLIHS